MKSIAEDLNVSEEKAQEIYNSVLTNIQGLKHLMDVSQEMARRLGYVETKWGRRRYIPEMQLEPYELKPKGMANFDPFFDSAELGVVNDVERLKQQFIKELLEAKYYKQKEKIKFQIQNAGFEIKENTKRIEDATRQCVNSRIQGSAADQSKIAMRLIGNNPDLKKYDFKMSLLVHDEILGEVPYVTAKKAIPIFTQCMIEAAKDLRTGAACDASIVRAWYGEEIDINDLSKEHLQELKKEIYTKQVA